MNPEAPVADQLKPNLSTSTPPTVGPKNALKIDCSILLTLSKQNVTQNKTRRKYTEAASTQERSRS